MSKFRNNSSIFTLFIAQANIPDFDAAMQKLSNIRSQFLVYKLRLFTVRKVQILRKFIDFYVIYTSISMCPCK